MRALIALTLLVFIGLPLRNAGAVESKSFVVNYFYPATYYGSYYSIWQRT